MLSKQDNEALTRVGPGTLIGDLMRQYWIPAFKSDELPAPDCPPQRLRLLGEEMIRLRQLLLKAARALRDRGEVPPAVDHPEVYAVRSGGIVLPNGVNGIEATLEVQQGRVRQDDFALAVPTPNYGV
jgi:hypothetical protein